MAAAEIVSWSTWIVFLLQKEIDNKNDNIMIIQYDNDNNKMILYSFSVLPNPYFQVFFSFSLWLMVKINAIFTTIQNHKVKCLGASFLLCVISGQ